MSKVGGGWIAVLASTALEVSCLGLPVARKTSGLRKRRRTEKFENGRTGGQSWGRSRQSDPGLIGPREKGWILP
jgi:hypothetical protein